MSLLGSLGSILSGGVTGLIGIGIKAYTSYQTKKLEYQHEEKMQSLAMESLKMEKQIALDQSRMKVTEAQVKVSGEALKTSYMDSTTESGILNTLINKDYSEKYGKTIGSIFQFASLLLIILRTSVRPVTTYYFEIFLTYIFIKVWTLTGGLDVLPKDKVLDLLQLLINNLLFCGTTVILWWFGSRQIDGIFGRKDK